jgi:hypothetical protein
MKMLHRLVIGALALAPLVMGGCTGIPPLVLTSDSSNEFILDVMDYSSFNPSLDFSNPYAAAAGKFSATRVLLSVGGALSRFIQFYSSVDFSRLVKSDPYNNIRDQDPPLANNVAHPCFDVGYEPEGAD